MAKIRDVRHSRSRLEAIDNERARLNRGQGGGQVYQGDAAMTPVDLWQGATILADAEDELIGRTLNNTYSVERVLGEGGMGRVYLARHTRIAQKRVAVKVLHPEYMRNADVLARFQREAETAASISHPNVVAVYDIDRTARGAPYLVSEYLEGLDLGQYLEQKNRLCLPTAVHIARQLCEGLKAAHACGVIHRDLKPHNVFLVGDFANGVPQFPFIKILDFGLSKFMDASNEQLVTKTGIIMGTPAFMPPEQAQGQPADLRSDIYGVGAILYTSLTGCLPFNESTPHATVLAVIAIEPTRPRALEPSIPEYAELVIQRAMAKLPAARYADMAELLVALEPLLEDHNVPHEVSSSRPGPRVAFDIQAERAKAARPKLVLFLCLSLVLLLGSASVAVAGIEQAAGWSLNRLEFGLLLTCGIVIAATPTLLVMRRIRRLVWENTGRVLGLLSGVRTAVITAVTTYGLAWIGFRVIDGVVLRLMGEPIRANLSWPGWDFLLPLIGVGAGVVGLLRERALSEMLSRWRRALVVALALVATLALAAFVIPVGLHWQAHQTGAASASVAATPTAAPAVSPKQTAQQEPRSPGATSSSPREAPPPPSLETAAASAASAPVQSPGPIASSQPTAQAGEEELRAATARGVDGLSPLAERYPTDARVIRALVLAHASRAAELGDAMIAARRLFQVAPDEAKSVDLQYLVQRAAETPGSTAELAWKLLAEDMGTYGFDVLYGFTLTKPKLAERAERLLDDAAAHQKLSPPLAIAHALKTAPSCAARLPLLDRATATGDERALAVLGALSTGTARGCGKNKRKPCWPACPEQAGQFREAMAKMSRRLKDAEK